MFLKLDNTNIGRKMYPLDASYSHVISGKGTAFIAGINGSGAKLVTILSNPYKLRHEAFGAEKESEFVTVQFEDSIMVVLNRFGETKPERIIFDDYHHIFKMPPVKPTPEMQKAFDLIAECSQKFLHKNDDLEFPYIRPDKD